MVRVQMAISALSREGTHLCSGEPEMMGDLPQQGEPCTARGLCADGLFCLNDSSNVDEATGRTIPYCTSDCKIDSVPMVTGVSIYGPLVLPASWSICGQRHGG